MAPNHGPFSGGSETAPGRGSNAIARDVLRSFIERIERLEEEKKAVADDIKGVFAEAAGSGFDTKVMRQVLRIRKQDKNERDEQQAILDMYLGALGMQESFDFDEPEREEYELKRGGDGPGKMMNAPGVEPPAFDDEPAHDPATGEIIEDEPEAEAEEPCDCADRAPVGEYYRCPKCYAEWFPEEEPDAIDELLDATEEGEEQPSEDADFEDEEN